MARRGAAGPRRPTRSPPPTAAAAPARAPTSSRGAARARSPARCAPAGCCCYAEPNRLARRLQGPAPDPLDARAAWRAAIVDARLVPPPVTPQSPLLALIDSQLDPAHPEFAGGNVSTLGTLPVQSAHGTETAAVAAAPKNDVGILGVWPGMRAVNVRAARADPLQRLRRRASPARSRRARRSST